MSDRWREHKERSPSYPERRRRGWGTGPGEQLFPGRWDPHVGRKHRPELIPLLCQGAGGAEVLGLLPAFSGPDRAGISPPAGGRGLSHSASLPLASFTRLPPEGVSVI